MTDRREDILARLTVIAEGFDGYTVGRNLTDLPDDALPALVLMDGDEEAGEPVAPGRRGVPSPVIVQMSPTLHAVLKGAAATLGPAMNTLRRDMIAAVLYDETLAALCLDGKMTYDACATGLFGDGMSIIAEIGLSFTFTYVLRPSEFQTA